jgi:predicted CoA-binding protein
MDLQKIARAWNLDAEVLEQAVTSLTVRNFRCSGYLEESEPDARLRIGLTVVMDRCPAIEYRRLFQ